MTTRAVLAGAVALSGSDYIICEPSLKAHCQVAVRGQCGASDAKGSREYHALTPASSHLEITQRASHNGRSGAGVAP